MPAVADLSAARIVVLGCGNPNRSDDGVGPHVIARLRLLDLPAQVALHDVGTDGMAVLYRTRGATHMIVVDARAPGGSPGAIYEVPGEVLAAPPRHGAGLHEFRWDHALHAGRLIHREEFPGAVKVLLVEAESLALGLSLSPPVAAAAEAVAERVASLVREWSA